MTSTQPAPTSVQYSNLQAAYTYFNETLFGGTLEDCLLVFGRDVKNCRGYFHAEQWQNGEDKCHTISLTPLYLRRPLKDVFGTLVHEMVHLWQEDHGNSSRSGYHNREWATKMKEVGLYPSSTGEAGGRETGQKVSHYIIEDGPFAAAFAAIPDSISLPWIGAAHEAKKKKVSKNKLKYTCEGCGANIWGKPDLQVRCEECDEIFLQAD